MLISSEVKRIHYAISEKSEEFRKEWELDNEQIRQSASCKYVCVAEICIICLSDRIINNEHLLGLL